MRDENVTSQVNVRYKAEQENARTAITKVVESLGFLGEQGLAIRGKENDSGNLIKLLKLRSKDVACLGTMVESKTKLSIA